MRKPDDVLSHRVQAVFQVRAGGGEAAAANVDDIDIVRFGEALGDETPGDGRASDARDQDDDGALAAVAEIMLADAVGIDVRAVEGAVAHAAFSLFNGSA